MLALKHEIRGSTKLLQCMHTKYDMQYVINQNFIALSCEKKMLVTEVLTTSHNLVMRMWFAPLSWIRLVFSM